MSAFFSRLLTIYKECVLAAPVIFLFSKELNREATEVDLQSVESCRRVEYTLSRKS
jgi:hypothetical protein